MELPILHKLKAGEKFDFDTLADNAEQTEEYWEWWWAEKANLDEISRPEIISDDEPLLVETVNKQSADLVSGAELFDRPLLRALQAGALPGSQWCSREVLTARILQLLQGSSSDLPGRPQLVFAGGGYGSGKTMALNYMAQEDALPVKMSDLVGVDTCKMFIPEFHLIKGIGDGRASLTVQKECQKIAHTVFENLVGACRSFAWDPSMSDQEATLRRVESARNAGYKLTMIAVLTPMKLAIRQAMQRALETRRFPNPVALPGSHQKFREAFWNYVPLFDRVHVFANLGAGYAPCYEVAVKDERENELVITDEPMFRHAFSSPED